MTYANIILLLQVLCCQSNLQYIQIEFARYREHSDTNTYVYALHCTVLLHFCPRKIQIIFISISWHRLYRLIAKVQLIKTVKERVGLGHTEGHKNHWKYFQCCYNKCLLTSRNKHTYKTLNLSSFSFCCFYCPRNR